MAATKINARNWVFEIFDGVSTYTQIGNIKTFKLAYSSTETDTTTFASLGNKESEVMERDAELTIEGFYLLDTGTGVQDAGQSAVETLAGAVGLASVQTFRITRPDNKKRTASFTATLGDQGGSNNDKTTWSAVLKRTGAFSAWA